MDANNPMDPPVTAGTSVDPVFILPPRPLSDYRDNRLPLPFWGYNIKKVLASGSLPPPQIYEHDPAVVSDRLRATILPQYSPQLEAIFHSNAWIQQNQPLDALLIKALLHKIRTGPSQFGCPFRGCVRQDEQSTKATEHIEDHLGHRPFVCDICNRTFRRAKDRDNHHDRHERRPPFQCPACQAELVDSKNLPRHLRDNCPSSRV